MLTANEAKRIAEANDRIKLSLLAHLAKIEQAANAGKRGITTLVPEDHTSLAIELQKLGYKVRYSWDPRGGHDDSMNISW